MNWLPSFRSTRPYFDATLLLIFPLAFSATLLLCVASTHGQTQVDSGEVLRIGAGSPEDQSILLNGGTLSTTGSPRQSAIQGAVELLSSSTILGNDGTLTVEGVISGPANSSLTFRRDSFRGGIVRLSGANDYEGLTVINSGFVIAENETALGSIGLATSITNSGRLRVDVPNSEAFFVAGTQGFDFGNNGNLRFTQDEDITNSIVFLSGDIVLAGEGDLVSRIQLGQQGDTEASLRGSGNSVRGGVAGVGDLTLRGSLIFEDAGLDHSGDTIVASGNNQFNVANSYRGDTFVRGSSATLEINNSSALGNSNNAVTVQDGGELVLNQNIDRDVALEAGRLTLGTGVVLDGNVTASNLSNIGGTGTFRGGIAIAGGDFNSLSLNGGDFDGIISGTGSLRTSGATRLNAANTYSGLSTIGGDTEINDANSLGSLDVGTEINFGDVNLNAVTEEALTITGGTLNVNVEQRLLPRIFSNFNLPSDSVLSLNGSGQYEEVADFSGTALAVRGESQISGIVVRNSSSILVESDSPGRLTTDSLVILDGSIEGQINTPSIRKLGLGTAELEGLTNFDGDILVENGTVSVGVGGFGSTNGVTRVASENARLSIRQPASSNSTLVVQEDIFLDNATGIRNQGGLIVGGTFGRTVRLEGRLDLGDTGSTIDAGFARDSGNGQGIFEIAGQVTGGDLTLLEGTTLLSGGDYDYTGQTIVRNGALLIREAGRLENTSGIELRNSRLSIGDVNTQGVQQVNDRISDLRRLLIHLTATWSFSRVLTRLLGTSDSIAGSQRSTYLLERT